jgi:hypothetical protein
MCVAEVRDPCANLGERLASTNHDPLPKQATRQAASAMATTRMTAKPAVSLCALPQPHEVERCQVATPEEQAGQAAVLAWLKSPTDTQLAERDALTGVRDYLTSDRKGPDSEFLRTLLPPTRPATRDDYHRARHDLLGWQSLGYDIDDVRPWLLAGLEPGEPSLAAELVAEGITPTRAKQQFEHPRTGERITVLDIARRFHIDFDSLNDALDDAGVQRVKGMRPSRWRRSGA